MRIGLHASCFIRHGEAGVPLKGTPGKDSSIVRVFADARGGIKGNTGQRLHHCQSV